MTLVLAAANMTEWEQVAAALAVVACSCYLLPGYSCTPNFKHIMVVPCMMQLPPSVGEYTGISIDGGDRVEGVNFLRHYSIELIGRGEVVDQECEIFWLVSARQDSKKIQQPERRTQYK